MFTWQPTMSVGVEEFVSHHKRIVELINKLSDSLTRADTSAAVREVLAEVSNYTLYHFFAEEDLMAKHGYPEYDAHRKEHLELTAKTFHLMSTAYGGHGAIGQEVYDFLVHWLTNHILITDKKYSAFFQERGIS